MIEAEKIHSIGWGTCKKIETDKTFCKREKTILAIGTDYKAKGIDILIKFANYLKDFQSQLSEKIALLTRLSCHQTSRSYDSCRMKN